MEHLHKSVFCIAAAIVLSVWISGCWTTTDKILEKTLLKEPANKGLLLLPNIPNILPNSYDANPRSLTQDSVKL